MEREFSHSSFDKIEEMKQFVRNAASIDVIPVVPDTWPLQPFINIQQQIPTDPCVTCSNNPAINPFASGICHCILGSKITY